MHAIEGGNSVPAFLTKLWRLVEDESNDDLISWTQSGRSFIIQNQARFSRELLPQYYKHNNMASFVRQLNMYGFHKVVSADSGGLKVDRDEMEFAHPHFLRGQENLLENIKRKQQRSRLASDGGLIFTQIPTGRTLVVEDSKNVTKLLNDVRDMKRDQDTMNNKLLTLKRENEALWREYANMRQKFTKQQQIIEKLIHFLIAMVKSPSKGLVPKRKFSHLALEGGDDATPTINKINKMHQFLQGNSIEVLQDDEGGSGGGSGGGGGAQIQEVIEEPDLILTPPQPSPPPPITTTTITTAATTTTTTISENSIPRDQHHQQQQHQHLQEQQQQQQQQQHLQEQQQPLEILGLSDETQDYIDIISTDHINATNVVSPEGTVMMGDICQQQHPQQQTSLIDDEASLSPELFNVVDPSIVTQSFMYPASNTPTSTTSTTTTEPLQSSFLVPAGDKHSPSTSTGTNSVVPSTHAHAHTQAGGGGGKLGGMKRVSAQKGKKINTTSSSSSSSSSSSNSSSSSRASPHHTADSSMRVAVPEKAIKNRQDLQNHVDDMQTTIDNLQDFLSTANLNVDTSMLHSVFGIDSYLPELDSMGTISSGNELSLYNPNLMDLANSIEENNDDYNDDYNDPFSFLNDTIPSTSTTNNNNNNNPPPPPQQQQQQQLNHNNTTTTTTTIPPNKSSRPPPPKHLKVTIKQEVVDSGSLDTPVISPAVSTTSAATSAHRHPLYGRGKRHAN